METKEKIIAIIVVTISLLAVTCFVGFVYMQRGANTQSANMSIDTRATDEEIANKGIDLSERNIFFAGIEDSVIRKGDLVSLENLKENEDFLMKYTLLDEEECLMFETDLIPSGQRVYWDPSVNLKVGDHKVTFIEQPYMESEGEYIPLTSGRNIVSITILEDEE